MGLKEQVVSLDPFSSVGFRIHKRLFTSLRSAVVELAEVQLTVRIELQALIERHQNVSVLASYPLPVC